LFGETSAKSPGAATAGILSQCWHDLIDLMEGRAAALVGYYYPSCYSMQAILKLVCESHMHGIVDQLLVRILELG
jgi:hypothetical protein